MKTGIFFHYQIGERLRDFPQALKDILQKENVFLYDALYPSKPPSSFDLEPISYEMLTEVHLPEMIEEVKKSGDFEGALLSASSTVRAAERIWSNEIDNAFVFTGYGDHHAGIKSFGGGCYFNGAAISIRWLQNNFGVKRFAIIDTDAHHGDGTWEIFEKDENILYICLCNYPSFEDNQKINIHIPLRIQDEDYLQIVKEICISRIKIFKPEILYWNWGYDGTRGEYGDIGLSPDLHISLARELKSSSEEITGGKMIIILCGGSKRELARYIIPRIIEVLAK